MCLGTVSLVLLSVPIIGKTLRLNDKKTQHYSSPSSVSFCPVFDVIMVFPDERNYICDQCGQTFKQRKHLSVHQMRHSGAKPLQ